MVWFRPSPSGYSFWNDTTTITTAFKSRALEVQQTVREVSRVRRARSQFSNKIVRPPRMVRLSLVLVNVVVVVSVWPLGFEAKWSIVRISSAANFRLMSSISLVGSFWLDIKDISTICRIGRSERNQRQPRSSQSEFGRPEAFFAGSISSC